MHYNNLLSAASWSKNAGGLNVLLYGTLYL